MPPENIIPESLFGDTPPAPASQSAPEAAGGPADIVPPKKGQSDEARVEQLTKAIFGDDDDEDESESSSTPAAPEAKKPDATAPEDDIDIDETGADGKKKNGYQVLKDKIKEVKTERDTIKSEYEAKLQQLEATLGEYKSKVDGVDVDTLKKHAEDGLKLKLIHDIRNHPEYKREILDKKEELESDIIGYALAAGLGKEEAALLTIEALKHENKHDRLLYLRSTLDGADVTIKINDLIGDYRNVLTKENAYFENAEQAKKDLDLGLAKNETNSDVARREANAIAVKGAFQRAAKSILESPNIVEYKDIPGDTEHNEKVAKPAREAAYALTAGILTKIVDSGAKLDEDLATDLVTILLKASVAETIAGHRNELLQELRDTTNSNRYNSSLDHPSVGAAKGKDGAKGYNFNDPKDVDRRVNDLMKDIFS